MRMMTLAPLALLAACGQSPSGDTSADAAPSPTETAAPAPTVTEPTTSPTLASSPLPAPVATPASCAEEIGPQAAQELADQCRAVSPATRPPCNVQNSCDLIRGEIERACELFADDPPAECSAG